MIWAKPTLENFGSIPRGVWWQVEEVGNWSDDCANLVGASKARGKDVIVTCVGTAGFRKHPNKDPVADGELRVATMAICLRDAFFGCQGESSAGLFLILLHAEKERFKGLVEGVFNHLGVRDVWVERRLVSEVDEVGGEYGRCERGVD